MTHHNYEHEQGGMSSGEGGLTRAEIDKVAWFDSGTGIQKLRRVVLGQESEPVDFIAERAMSNLSYSSQTDTAYFALGLTRTDEPLFLSFPVEPGTEEAQWYVRVRGGRVEVFAEPLWGEEVAQLRVAWRIDVEKGELVAMDSEVEQAVEDIPASGLVDVAGVAEAGEDVLASGMVDEEVGEQAVGELTQSERRKRISHLETLESRDRLMNWCLGAETAEDLLASQAVLRFISTGSNILFVGTIKDQVVGFSLPQALRLPAGELFAVTTVAVMDEGKVVFWVGSDADNEVGDYYLFADGKFKRDKSGEYVQWVKGETALKKWEDLFYGGEDE